MPPYQTNKKMKKLTEGFKTTFLHHNPTAYFTNYNNKGQKYSILEHPLKGDSVEVFIYFEDLDILFKSDFFDADEHQRTEFYEPYCIDEKLIYSIDITI